jgi:hypothetical protein
MLIRKCQRLFDILLRLPLVRRDAIRGLGARQHDEAAIGEVDSEDITIVLLHLSHHYCFPFAHGEL